MIEIPAIAWLIFGFALIILEMLSMSLVLLFFGLSALLVAAAKWMGLNQTPAEILLFAVLGIASLLIFRKKLRQGLNREGGFSTDQHAKVVLPTDIPSHGTGQIEYQGTLWTAVNDSDRDLRAGTRVSIERTEGIKLIVKGEPS